jgi:glycosyltransferase involved in cell wall biosynthesis
VLTATPKPSSPTFSIVVPVHNESESVEELVASIEAVGKPLEGGYEIVFVDDGSTDDTLERLKDLARTHRHIRVFSFRRKLGKSPALHCGLRKATGEYVLTMDADLQDDPRDLEPMYEQLIKERLDMVSGWRRERRDSLLKVISSKVFNSLVVRLLFGVSFRDMNSGIKLYRADVVRELPLYGGMHRFIPLIVSEMGYRVAEAPVRHHQRKYGASKYRSTKILTEVPDLLTVFFLIRYTTRPLHFFGRVGSLLFATGFAVLELSDLAVGARQSHRHSPASELRCPAGAHRRADRVHRVAGRSDRQHESEPATHLSAEVHLGRRPLVRGVAARLNHVAREPPRVTDRTWNRST